LGRILSPFATTKHPALARLLCFHFIALITEAIDFIQHALQQSVGRSPRNPRPLQLEYFLSLPPDLDAHVFDLSPDVIEVRHPFRPKITM
jgi:hypothetical protein